VINMSPEIKINGKLIADVPDETGLHKALDSSPLYVNVDHLDAHGERQLLIVEGPAISGRRLVSLTQEGVGSSDRKGGDKKEPRLDAILHDRPIRVTYSPRVWPNDEHLTGGWGSYYYEDRVTRHNPRWVRGHGQR
jgi:hypothetical protein